MSKSIAVLSAVAALWAFSASAGPSQISWDEFKRRCEDPKGQGGQQVQPENIKILCADTFVSWVPAQPGEVPLNGAREIVHAVFSDKFVVNAEKHGVPTQGKQGACPRFKEVKEEVTVERPLSCGEVLSIKGGLKDFCVGVVDYGKGSGSKGKVSETGRIIDTCGAGGVQNGKPKP